MSTKSRALREILASVDQLLRLFPSCFAILPAFTATTTPGERLATIKECAESAREGSGLCPLPATTSRVALRVLGEAAERWCNPAIATCAHTHLTPPHLPDRTSVSVDTCARARPLRSVTHTCLITEQLRFGQGMEGKSAIGQGGSSWRPGERQRGSGAPSGQSCPGGHKQGGTCSTFRL